MPARLSSLLVRDGLVGVKRMEKAFQRQVIYGGSLDTILLEMNLIPEDRLTQYLALASGLPPAARAEGSSRDADAIAMVPRELAEAYRVVPLAVAGEAVRVLVCSPLEITKLEDLADQIDRPLQPLIAPEYRWHLGFAFAYGLDPPARFTTLARSLDFESPATPVGRPPSIIIDERSASRVTRPPSFTDEEVTEEMPVFAHRAAQAPSTPPRPPAEIVEKDEAPVRDRRHTLIGVNPNRATTDAGPSSPTPNATRDPGGATAGISAATRHPSDAATAQPPVAPPAGSEGRDSALSLELARELLSSSEDRDTVFLTLLRAMRWRARFAALLTVQGGAAIGRVALAESGIDTELVHTILIPLDIASVFQSVVGTRQPHVGPLGSGDPSIDSMVLRMGGTIPPSALVMPIVLRDRVVALVVAHRVNSGLQMAEVSELLPLATAASEAVGRLIIKHKSAHIKTSVETAVVVAIDVDAMDTQKITRADHGGRPSEQAAALAVDQGVELAITEEPSRPIDTILDEIERAHEGQAQGAIADAMDRAGETLGCLMRRFPGALRVDRFAVSGRSLRAAQYGGLLELVISLGSVASEMLIEKMGAAQRDVRFYATLCAAELRPRNAVAALAERLFDQDFGVRASAIEALSGYPVQDLGHALVRARRGVHSTEPDVVHAATAAIVELADIGSIADLIGVIERNDRAGDHARKALIALTAQDFGHSERRWRKWWDAARKRHRIEWLIEGLGHKEDAIREAAINDLRRLTGEYFGYHHDLPRREREACAAKWSTWWRDVGHRRFVKREGEHRPSGEPRSGGDPV